MTVDKLDKQEDVIGVEDSGKRYSAGQKITTHVYLSIRKSRPRIGDE